MTIKKGISSHRLLSWSKTGRLPGTQLFSNSVICSRWVFATLLVNR